jgi:hypothetical protein
MQASERAARLGPHSVLACPEASKHRAGALRRENVISQNPVRKRESGIATCKGGRVGNAKSFRPSNLLTTLSEFSDDLTEVKKYMNLLY